ncbi:M23 family metallopeptidase [Dendrosporobacter sp. 1207_IL3150]|uniref:M23 family metallopeptidase n=1 Tax=Dendrosporobacter sp. 1207_IL3150 TaxID=3084054 RepID=UPI002FD92E91
MPGSLRPITYLREKLKEILKPGWIEPKPILGACSLLIVAGVMLFAVAVSLKNSPVENPNNVVYVGPNTKQEPDPVKENIPSKVIQEAAKKDEKASSQQSPTVAAAAAINQTPHWPVKGEIKTEFGWHLHPVFNDWRYHPGIDIAVAEGTLIQAIFSGQITEIYSDKNTGLTVVIESGKYTISYGSLAAVNVSLRKGSYVNGGDKIGTTGVCNTEPYTHLHLTVQQGDKYIDPRKILK